MRCAPYSLAFRDEWSDLVRVSAMSSAITHADPRCTYGCVVLNLTLAGLLAQRPTPLRDALDHIEADAPEELLTALRSVPDGVNPDTLSASGYVVDTLQTSLYHGLTADTAEEAIVSAVNMEEDTDTVGAVTELSRELASEQMHSSIDGSASWSVLMKSNTSSRY